MSKKAHEPESRAQAPALSKASSKDCLRQLQVARLNRTDPRIVFAYDVSNREHGRLAK